MAERNPYWLKAADPDHLRWLYVNCEMSCYDIANLFNCGATTVKRYLFGELGVTPRETGQLGNSPFYKWFNGIPEHLKAIHNSCRKTLRAYNASDEGKLHNQWHVRQLNRAPLSKAQETLVIALREAGWDIPDNDVNYEYVNCLSRQYFLDIADPECLLCVEVDGWTHDIPSRKESDELREILLIQEGWTVLRYRDGEVFDNLDKIVVDIMEQRRNLHERKAQAVTCGEIV